MAVVLIVDDHKGIAGAVAEMVRCAGREAAVAHSGPEALALARARPVDLVVLDVSMPGMSGLDVLRAIRRDRMLQGLPVVMFSASDEGRDESIDLGAVGFVLKSEVDDLEALIEKHAAGGAVRVPS